MCLQPWGKELCSGDKIWRNTRRALLRGREAETKKAAEAAALSSTERRTCQTGPGGKEPRLRDAERPGGCRQPAQPGPAPTAPAELTRQREFGPDFRLLQGHSKQGLRGEEEETDREEGKAGGWEPDGQ